MTQQSQTVTIKRPSLHDGQKILLAQRKRFNVVRCGRRFGKTVFASYLLVNFSKLNFPIAYFAPTYKSLNEVWKEIVLRLTPIIAQKDTQLKQLTLITGCIIDFWSLDNPNAPRGRKYKIIIVDEAAFVDSLEETFNKVLRPLLTDFKGDAWFLSTPQGYNDFQLLDEKSKTSDSWASFHMPTSTNPYISRSEIEEIKSTLPMDVYLQEYEAEYVNFDGKSFLQYFSREKNVVPHDSDGQSQLEWNPNLDTYLSFDFNVVSTCLVIQKPDEQTTVVLREYHNDLFDLPTLCKQILADYLGGFFIINGDASGRAQSALTTGNENAYNIIKTHLDISWQQFNVPSANPSHLNSYIHCNYMFKNYKFLIDESCIGLITDCERVKVERKNNKFQIIKTDDKLTHWSDCLRYHINAEDRAKLKFIDVEET